MKSLNFKKVIPWIASALVIGLFVIAQVTPGTQSAFNAKITNSTNTVKTAFSFTCNAFAAGASGNTDGVLFAYAMNQASGSTTAPDYSTKASNGTYRGNMTSTPLITSPPVSACPRDAGGIYNLNGTNSYLTNNKARASTNVFTEEVWFKTSVGGGRLIGFGSSLTGLSNDYDRHIVLGNTGNLIFGVFSNNAAVSISSSGTYIDNTWHHVAATLSPAGMILYVDGAVVASNAAVTTGETTASGYWRIGYDNLDGWGLPAPVKYFYTGQMRYAAVWSKALTATQIQDHYISGK